MSIFLRILLLVVSFFTFWYVVRKIRKSQMQIEDTVFWLGFVFVISMLGAFPSIGIFFAYLIGFDSAVNFIFLCIIFVLLIKCFFQSIQISQLENKIKSLSQRMGLNNAAIENVQKDRQREKGNI